jgi:hypothetical protein
MTSMDAPSFVTETSNALQVARDQAAAQKDYQQLMDYQRDLATRLATLEELAAAADLGRKRWWSGRIAPPSVWTALDKATRRPEPRELAELRRVLEVETRELRDMLQRLWHQYAGEELSQGANLRPLATVLKGIGSIRDTAERLEGVLGGLQQHRTPLPTPEVVSLLEECRRLQDDISAQLRPEAVRRFFASVSRGGAHLDLLTQDVREWLDKHQAGPLFKVVPGRPANE